MTIREVCMVNAFCGGCASCTILQFTNSFTFLKLLRTSFFISRLVYLTSTSTLIGKKIAMKESYQCRCSFLSITFVQNYMYKVNLYLSKVWLGKRKRIRRTFLTACSNSNPLSFRNTLKTDESGKQVRR